ncbi:hypothetical protein [Gordoniibacillus kamchatkensis]|uniref:hypothetical protein n=1 Tax=Gordoniibacillus kamchatkensis TaxID=1590651 RepID=UPI000AA97BE1|nr:hypothetical protein [Paenibacillus sp. VKM B-2647]
MLDNRSQEMQQFLDQIQFIEAKVVQLIAKSNLSEQEKLYILKHILIVPGTSDEVN